MNSNTALGVLTTLAAALIVGVPLIEGNLRIEHIALVGLVISAWIVQFTVKRYEDKRKP